MRSPITDAVADILHEQDADAARALLAEAILVATDSEIATRVSVTRGRPDALMRIHGHGHRPAASEMPCAADVRAHPLFRFRAATRSPEPVRLGDVVRAGWALEEPTLRIFERLRVSAHQADLAVASGGEYDGWTLIAPSAITRLQLRPIVQHARLLRGLDRHVELLARVGAAAPEPAEGAPRLTPRERTVLHLMHLGRTAAAIGATLGVSERTVHKHQEHLYRKLGARDRLSAVLLGQRSGLLPTARGEEAAASGASSRD
ncbi:helix-turn-helix transcriptional regulator [Agrococcus carbonis]|nr:helix-turn-helix transcriptional regulator [Agrococcus carbonis]